VGTGGFPVSERLSHCHVVAGVVALPLLLSSIQPKMHGPRTHSHAPYMESAYLYEGRGEERMERKRISTRETI